MTISGTKEWAATNENILFGCQHDCRYCYAKAMSVRHKKIDIRKWHDPILRLDKINKRFGKRSGTIMFPTVHDIHPDHIDVTVDFLKRLLKPGNDVLIVSKPHLSCIQRLCEELSDYKNNILYRFTIGSASDDVLVFWEPNAPTFQERLDSLVYAFDQGFKTSVSCEPMLDNRIDLVVDEVSDYVTDSIWLGKKNGDHRCKINQTDEKEPPWVLDKEMQKIMAYQLDENIMKLYDRFKDNPKIKWKESIKKVVGLDLATEKGLDI